MMKIKRNLLSFLFIIMAVFCFFTVAMASEGIKVNAYYGTYDVGTKEIGFPAKSLDGPKEEIWMHPKPQKAYHIGVSFPHLKDSYWVAANYGIISHAEKLGVKITLYEAGAYTNFGKQREQLNTLAEKDKVDGIIIASVDYEKMDTFVEKVVNAGKPVIELINDVSCPAITAKSLLSFYDMGAKAADFVIQDSKGKDSIKVAFFPGPEKSGWAPDTYKGFDAALQKEGANIQVLPPQYGDTRPEVQMLRIKQFLSKPENHNIDYIVGNAVASVEAVKYLEENRNIHPNAKIVSTYITITVYEQIEKGKIAASPSDQTVDQCRIALDMMVRVLNGEKAGKDFGFRISPLIPLITKENIAQYSFESLFGTKGYEPVVN